ncbi:MAG: IS66 family transposase [Magnetococcales bacterium]|nr:IS66 family transposase [Magnetococcales bacterium]
MDSIIKNLPEDPVSLKKLLVEKFSEIDKLKEDIGLLQEQINILLAKRFGPSSEKQTIDISGQFDEAEQDQESPDSEELETIEVPAHARKKPKRKPLPKALPREDVIHDLPVEDRICSIDGSDLVEVGQEISEQLEIIPAQFKVIRNIRIKYGCPHCHKGIKTAVMPPQPIPKSMAAPGLLAYIVTSKYVDGLPLYRQTNMLQRIGMDLSRSTLSHWMIKLGILIQPLINLLRDHLLASGYVQMDETTVQVLNEKDRPATSKSYMWVQRSCMPGGNIILFDYDPTRKQEVPKRLLEGFSGYLQTDGYAGYNLVGSYDEVILLACWAHARRKFDEAVKAIGKKGKNKPGRAQKGLSFIQSLYQIERRSRKMTHEDRYTFRQEHALPILEKFKKWLKAAIPEVPPKSALGVALGYSDNLWPRLIRYLDDGCLEIDNNGVENAIRPFVLGRKGWLFSSATRGAEASANLYSLIETAKANGHEPYRYLRHVFTGIPKAETIEEFEALLPMNLPPKSIS